LAYPSTELRMHGLFESFTLSTVEVRTPCLEKEVLAGKKDRLAFSLHPKA